MWNIQYICKNSIIRKINVRWVNSNSFAKTRTRLGPWYDPWDVMCQTRKFLECYFTFLLFSLFLCMYKVISPFEVPGGLFVLYRWFMSVIFHNRTSYTESRLSHNRTNTIPPLVPCYTSINSQDWLNTMVSV